MRFYLFGGLLIGLSLVVLACAPPPSPTPTPTSPGVPLRPTPTIRPDLPLPPDAFNLDVTTARIAFDTKMSVQELVEFYSTQMPQQGWQVLGAPTQYGQVGNLLFQKDGTVVNIQYQHNDLTQITSVQITLP
ncbi:hypothetical protein [Thermoflexus sp.]|uniref:hypothetical protein n=1 Tax=Thermoflexus sp. TaxID=1969742 RepID=UPI0025E99C84|nr:hypothetical protein [Thermoflexus sp.]MDW8181502.1 hypothetical protein [Anaerolineae bacterium]MCS6962643.1 hypothetical protein [Thermoflexus sp.]MCS7352043.1 hypothetical protein [Thermoflexus sp.]MCX7690792.1 hypothetical protein [Thermoflexus sp.]MDW8185226.1 hypothetical protein [Anaerolineae bacterium]